MSTPFVLVENTGPIARVTLDRPERRNPLSLQMMREATAAIRALGDDPDCRVVVAGHSTGGLITALWLDRLRQREPALHAAVDGLLLNSPWFDLQGDAVLRTLPVTLLVKAVAAVAPTRVRRC